MSKDGYARPTHKWSLMISSSGEHSLEHDMRAAGIQMKKGQESRLMNYRPDRAYGCFDDIGEFDHPGDFAKMLDSECFANHGTLWPRFYPVHCR